MADTPLTPEERMERAEGNAASETYAEVVPIEKAANGLLRHQLLTFGQVLDLPPPEPLVEGWIDKATLNVIYGKPKLGKTFVGLDLALCVATGAYWHGVPVEKTNVLYIAAEGVPYYPPRLRAWQAVNNIHNTPEGFTLFNGRIDLLDPSAVAELHSIIEELEIGLVIPDTLARCMPGAEENSSQSMGIAVDNMSAISRATGASFCAIHHSGKDESKGLRGSSALLGAVDSSIVLKASGSGIRLHAEDQRGHAQPSDKFFRLEDAADGAAIVDIDRDGATLEDLGLEKCEPTLKALIQIETEHGATSSEWKRQAMEKGVSEATFDRHKKALGDMGEVHQLKARGPWFTGPKPVPEDG